MWDASGQPELAALTANEHHQNANINNHNDMPRNLTMLMTSEKL